MLEQSQTKVTKSGGQPAIRHLQSLQIAVVGAGALGSALCELLANAGVHCVLLIDPDDVDARNLPLSPFLRQAVENDAAASSFRDQQPNLNKAELLATEAARSYSLPWRALPAAIADAGWQYLQNCDVICSCTDSTLARVETAFAARTLGKPMLDGGVLGQGLLESRVTWFAAVPQAACYLCGLSAERRAQILAYAASTSLGCTALQDAPRNTAHLRTIQHTAAVLFQEILSFAQDRIPENSRAQRLSANCDLPVDPNWQTQEVLLLQSLTCPWHDRTSGRLHPLPGDTPIAEILTVYPGNLLQLAWPVCTLARCRLCQKTIAPHIRVAQARREAICPHCEERGTLEPLAAVSSITQNSHAATRTLRQLGQPEQHLYLLRPPFIVKADKEQEAKA